MEVIIKNAKFVISNVDVKKCPEPVIPEYAFIGRSNVGKSTLINMLTMYGKLAKISSQPGKTQTINHFLINDSWYLVDLPGYGYAKPGKALRIKWDRMIKDYMFQRENLVCVFVLIDSRHSPQANDVQLMELLGKKEIPFVMVFTKIDKLSSSQLNKNLVQYKKEMLKKWDELPEIFLTSGATKLGRQEILSYIEKNNLLLKEHFDKQI